MNLKIPNTQAVVNPKNCAAFRSLILPKSIPGKRDKSRIFKHSPMCTIFRIYSGILREYNNCGVEKFVTVIIRLFYPGNTF